MSATPGPWHVAVQPSEVDPHEEERPTGLIVQHQHDHADTCENKLKRGVILAIGTKAGSDDCAYDFEIGDVIFYFQGVKLRGLEYVYPTFDNVIAYEKRDD